MKSVIRPLAVMVVFFAAVISLAHDAKAQSAEEELNWTNFSNKQRANDGQGNQRENADYVLVTYDKESIKFIYPDRNDLVIKFPISSKFQGIDDTIFYTSEAGISNIRLDSDRNVTVYYEDDTIIQFETDLYFYWSEQDEDKNTAELSEVTGGR